MSETVQFNLINQSNDNGTSEIVIFQKNAATNFEELTIAWMVIKNLSPGWHHPFTYSPENNISVTDSYGNESMQLAAQAGENFKVVASESGEELTKDGSASSSNEISINNELQQGSIAANIYRDGKLLDVEPDVAPAQKAVFEFKPTIWIGVASDITEGQMITSAVMSQINTEISLLGMASADIIMKGGGSGPDAEPFSFTLENIKNA